MAVAGPNPYLASMAVAGPDTLCLLFLVLKE